jgi:hypothetical protein
VDTRFNGEALRAAGSAKGMTHHQLARKVHLPLAERILDIETGIAELHPV